MVYNKLSENADDGVMIKMIMILFRGKQGKGRAVFPTTGSAILTLRRRPAEAELQGMGPRNGDLKNPPGDCINRLILWTTGIWLLASY